MIAIWWVFRRKEDTHARHHIDIPYLSTLDTVSYWNGFCGSSALANEATCIPWSMAEKYTLCEKCEKVLARNLLGEPL